MKRRLLAALILVTPVVAVILLFVWWVVLYRRFQPLLAVSSRFPREYALGLREGPIRTCVILGDSTAVGTGATDLGKTFVFRTAAAFAGTTSPVRVINLAKVGARLQDIILEQIPSIEKLKPDLVLVAVGANDATHFTPDADYRQQMDQLIARLKLLSCRVLIAETPDMRLVPALPLGLSSLVARRSEIQNIILRDEVAAAIHAESSLNPNRILIVPLFEKGKLDPHENPEYYAADRFHPSDAGYARWASLFLEELSRFPSGKRS